MLLTSQAKSPTSWPKPSTSRRAAYPAMPRLDQDLARRGLVRSRSEAAELIAQGRVLVDGIRARKPSARVDADTKLEISEGPRFVGRGGSKLGAALDHFDIDVTGQLCLDIGASTGGFTDCLLQRGAAKVIAVDVGTDQLHPSLRNDPRVDSREGADIRGFVPRDLGGPFSLVVVDVSFVSICALAANIAPFVSDVALILVKPQFEVGKNWIGRGVVSRADDRRLAVDKAETCLRDAGLDSVVSVDSTLPGEHGNREVFLLVRAK